MKLLLGLAFFGLIANSFKIDVEQVGDVIDCAKEKCPDQYAACGQDPKCMPIIKRCNDKCGTSQNCWVLCLQEAGNQPAHTLARCALGKGCLGAQPIPVQNAIVEVSVDPQQCIQQKCPNEWKACDSRCVYVLQKCQSRCGKVHTCLRKCLQAQGNIPAGAVLSCAAKHHCI